MGIREPPGNPVYRTIAPADALDFQGRQVIEAYTSSLHANGRAEAIGLEEVVCIVVPRLA